LGWLEMLETQAKETKCLRKGVGSGLFNSNLDELIMLAINGPVHDSIKCTNEKGNCGCGHAEPRVIIEALKGCKYCYKYTMISSFSPCLPCTDAILKFGRINTVIYDVFAPHHPQACNVLRAAGIYVIDGETLRHDSK
jgi:deoxycytidylate deaminase